MLYPQGAELAREAEASLQAGDLPGPLAGLVNEYIEGRFGDREELARHALPQRRLSVRLAVGREDSAGRGRSRPSWD